MKDFEDILSKYGIKGILFFVAFTATTAILKSKWFSENWGKMVEKLMELTINRKSKSIKKEITESDIINHDIFNYIDFWIHSKIPTFQFSTEYRTIIFRRYLTIFLKKYKSQLHDFVHNKEYEKWDESELWKNLLNLINNIVRDYEKDMEDNGIPKIVIEKMKVKNNDTITLSIDLIEGISNSQFYSSDKNYLKMYSILNILLSVLENTVHHSEQVCNSINGQLKGLVVDGKVEP